MTLVPLTLALAESKRRGGALAAFNVIQIEHAEAYAAAAAQTDLPVVMQISENCVRYHGALRPIGLATLAIAEAAPQPVVVHLDHAEDSALVDQAVELGFTSVMFDGSTLDYDANVALTAELAAYCHAHGVGIEAELGEVARHGGQGCRS